MALSSSSSTSADPHSHIPTHITLLGPETMKEIELLFESYSVKMKQKMQKMLEIGVELVKEKFKDFENNTSLLISKTVEKDQNARPPTARSPSAPKHFQSKRTSSVSCAPETVRLRRGQGERRRGGGRRRRESYNYNARFVPNSSVPSINDLMVDDEWAEDEEQRFSQQQPKRPQPILHLEDVLDQLF